MSIYSIKYSMRPKNLIGNLLVANPLNPKDGLEHSVVLVVSQGEGLNLGLQVNEPTNNITLASVFMQLGMWYDGDDLVYYGGNMNPSKIHVIHSTDWEGMTTVQINDDIAVTNDISVLTAIGRGEGPEYFRACAGFWAWEKDTLDAQLNNRKDALHRWEVAPATLETVFSEQRLDQWHLAISASARSQVASWL